MKPESSSYQKQERLKNRERMKLTGGEKSLKDMRSTVITRKVTSFMGWVEFIVNEGVNKIMNTIEEVKSLWCDLKTDQEKADFIRKGEAYVTGILAREIQKEVAEAFQFRADYYIPEKE